MTFNSGTNRIATVGSTTVIYDAAGNVISDDAPETHQWDAEGRMVSINNGTAGLSVFNALGQRVDQTGSSVHYAYLFHADGSELADWRVGSGIWGNAYFNLSGRPIAKYWSGAAYFLHTNPARGGHRVRAVVATQWAIWEWRRRFRP